MPINIIKLTPASTLAAQAPQDVGDIVECISGVAPAGWMTCNGQSLPVAAYPQLFSQIGYTYGGSGLNFNLPNLNVITPVLYNAIRNPEMIVAQRGTSGTATTGTAAYTIDGWQFTNNSSVSQTWNQIIGADIPADTSGNNWYPYIPACYTITTTASGTLAAGAYLFLQQTIEGWMAANLKGRPTSISFLVNCSITGTFSVALRNFTTCSIVYPIVIPTANVWQRVTIPNIPAFPTGSYSFPDGNAGCYYLSIGLAGGTNYVDPASSTWTTTNVGTAWAITGQTNFLATAGTTFDFTAVQHEPNPTCNPYIRRELEAEIALNYRYLNTVSGLYLGPAVTANWTYNFGLIPFPFPMRNYPTLTAGSVFGSSTTPLGTVAINGGDNSHVNIYNSASNWVPSTAQWISFNGGFTAEL